MRGDMRIVLLLLIGLVAGCTTVPASLPRETALFKPAGSDSDMFTTLSENQQALLESCEHTESCDEVHFTGGLLGLFADRDVAAASFRRTLEINPHGPFAISSTRWLELLAGPSAVSLSEPTDSAMKGATEGLVRTWLHQKYLACKLAIPDAPTAPAKAQPSLVALKRRIAEREKRVADLMAQLEALKEIELTKGNKKTPPVKLAQ